MLARVGKLNNAGGGSEATVTRQGTFPVPDIVQGRIAVTFARLSNRTVGTDRDREYIKVR